MGNMEAFFHWMGTVEVMMDRLKSADKGSAKTWLPRRRNQAGNPSSPIAVGSR